VHTQHNTHSLSPRPPRDAQIYSYYVSQNNQYVSLDSAPKYVLLPGFSCTIAAVVFLGFSFVADIWLALSSRHDHPASSAPSAASLRSSPTHIAHYHVTSPLSLAATAPRMIADQP
jgi:hypothetical protein